MVYGHALSEQREFGEGDGPGMQSTYSGHEAACSHPQPQLLLNIVVFVGHVNLMTWHWAALVPVYLRLYSVVGLQTLASLGNLAHQIWLQQKLTE